MNVIIEVRMPRLGVNDDKARIVEWLHTPGEPVVQGETLAHAETTKAAFEIECETEGYIYPLVEAGSEISVRDVIALISHEPDENAVKEYRERHREPAPKNVPELDGIRLTAKARTMVEAHNVDVNLLPRDRIVRESDVLALIETEAPAGELVSAPATVCEKVVVYGASQGGLAIVECFRSRGQSEVLAFLDDSPERIGRDYCSIPVWPGDDLKTLRERGIGGISTHIADGGIRLQLLRRAEAAGVVYVNAVHAFTHIAPTVRMGKGNVVKAGAVLDAYVELGDCCIIDNGVIVPHHNRIGNGCHLAPGVSMGGDCDIGDRSVIGVGAVIAARTKIGRNVLIATGVTVSQDIPDNAVVDGFPARIVGKRKLEH